jgi:hypothetical protein
MIRERSWSWSIVVAVALAAYAVTTTSVWAKGGGGHGGGGHHAGGGGHHGGGHHANHHPYHPSHHHEEHHASHHGDHHDGHHHVAHHNHHHENWHHGNWGPGFWGGAALGYGAGYAWAPWGGYYGGGDTYVDNSTNVTPAYNDSGDADDSSDDSSDNADDSSNDQSSPNTAGSGGFPTDDWPELGIVTYAGEYGASQGQVIVSIVPGSAGSKAGFVPGDVILSLNGQPVPSADALDTALDQANGQFTAEVWDARTGRKSTIEGKLDANAPATTETASVVPQS